VTTNAPRGCRSASTRASWLPYTGVLSSAEPAQHAVKDVLALARGIGHPIARAIKLLAGIIKK
jgi:hypothetical protein